MRVLIVEDEARLARNIAQVLTEEVSYAVDISTEGEDGLHMARTNPYDLIILDLLLPKLGGLEILRSLRAAKSRTPILVLTARDTTAEIRRGLDLGADDYLTKPFDMGELVARCRAIIRRAYDRPTSVIAVEGLKINTANHAVTSARQDDAPDGHGVPAAGVPGDAGRGGRLEGRHTRTSL